MAISVHKVSEELFFIDRSNGRPLQAQVCEAVVSAVLDGRMPPGARLPSTRALAKHLSVSRITITLAFQELVSQGYLVASARSGFSVCATDQRRVLGDHQNLPVTGQLDWGAKLRRDLELRPQVEKPKNWRSFPFPFVYGQMDMSLFHHRAWRNCAWKALGRRDFEAMAEDMAESDDPMLINYIWSRALPRRGITAEPDEILVTLGAQNALWLTVQLLARTGVHAVCENPCYPDIANALQWSGARTTRIDVDDQGLPAHDLPSDTDLVFVTPSHHAPTAVTMPASRRAQLLNRASEQDFLIIEDDYEFEMSFLAPASPALKSLDGAGRVIYIGSFSKALFPGLRLGYLVGPKPFIREARRLRSLVLRHPPGHQQRTVAYFLALGHYDGLIRDMREAFAKRRALMTDALEREQVEISNTASFGGTNFWIKGPDDLDSVQLAQDLRADGVLIEPGAPFFENHRTPVQYFRMAYSSIAEDRIDEGVKRLARRLHAR